MPRRPKRLGDYVNQHGSLDVVSIGELAIYLDVDFDALFASLAVVNFDTTYDWVPRELHRLERQATSKARLAYYFDLDAEGF